MKVRIHVGEDWEVFRIVGGWGREARVTKRTLRRYRKAEKQWRKVQSELEAAYDKAAPKPPKRYPLTPIEQAMAGWYHHEAMRRMPVWLDDELLPRLTAHPSAASMHDGGA